MPAVEKINHVAIVVDDLDAALGFWRDALGLELTHVEEVSSQESIVAFLPTGDSEVELVKPTTTTSGIAKYLEKRGPGIHHLCLEVRSLDAVLARLKALNIRLINETPTIGAGGARMAFIHPSAAYGVLVELYETRRGTGALSATPFPVLGTGRLALQEDRNTDPHDGGNVRRRTLAWRIVRRDRPDESAGKVAAILGRPEAHSAQLSFSSSPEQMRQGLVDEALTTILDYLFNLEPLAPVYRVEVLLEPEAELESGVVRRLGFLDEGVRRAYGYSMGKYRDLRCYALTKPDWNSR